MRVAIVGGGVGGPACAQRLAKRGGAIEVQLIERTLRHDFAPSFLWLLTGQRAPERASRSLAPLRGAGVELTEADPAVRMRAPARHLHSGKVLFERRWLARLRCRAHHRQLRRSRSADVKAPMTPTRTPPTIRT